MEKNRWVLIFIGLCLALVFSMSPVEAQMHHDCGVCAHCDRDGDTLIKDTPPCRTNCPDFMIDPNDREPDGGGPNMCRGGDSETFDPVVICHFKNILKHCEIGNSGVFVGGGERTITSQKQLDQHLAHGDCVDIGVDFISNPSGDPIDCGNHCVAVRFPEARCADIP